MALIVETGAGLANADAFATLATVEAYHEARGNSAWTSSTDDDAKEAAIRRATTYVSTAFTWKGQKSFGRAQSLTWPRIGVVDEDGWDVAADSIPNEVIAATCEAALYELSEGSLSPSVVLTERVVSETVGPLSTTYAQAGSVEAARPKLTALRDIVRGLLLAGVDGCRIQRA